MVAMNPQPEAVGEQYDQAKRVAISDAMGSRRLC